MENTMSVTTAELNDLFRYCEDIGMAATDRPINDTKNHEGSCDHRTVYCDETCYNVKLYKIYPKMADRDDRCETIWKKLNRHNSDFTKFFSRKRYDTSRVRHMTRGEAFKTSVDVYRVKTMCLLNSDIMWWIPTRAWRDTKIKALIEKELMPLPNCAINASFDPSNTDDEWKMMIDSDWNIMFYGDDDLTTDPIYGKRMFKCPKTHKGLKGHCLDCKAGCFAQKAINRTAIVHLSEH
tara:strand:+ start:1888 stop:2598 length:711 start_codon:yes stop_codon:yes gene_type:complete